MLRRAAAAACAAACAAAAPAVTTLTVAASPTFGTWQGWGVSLAWWANVWGEDAALADAVFSRAEAAPLANTTVPGLALTRARYNAGASSTIVAADGSRMVASPNIPTWKQIDAFWVDWAPGAGSWRWDRDARQVAMLRAAAARGATAFELFSNSPVWWMCANHNPSGSADGASDNLQPWNHAQHATYLATIAAHARDAWGINFTTIEAFNEPIASWWKADGTQEGCHFDAATQAAVLAELPAALAAAGVAPRIAASDESRIDMAQSTWAAWAAPTRALVADFNVHGYQEGGDRAGLYDAVVVKGGKALHDSEYGDGDGTGGTMVGSILADWAALHPVSWAYWQIVDVAAGWALVVGDAGSRALGPVNAKWFALAQFSRHIPAGATILAVSGGAGAAALDAARNVLVVVLQNYAAAAADFAVDVSAFDRARARPAAAWITTTAAAAPAPGAAHSPLAGVAVDAAGVAALRVPAWGVVTLEVSLA